VSFCDQEEVENLRAIEKLTRRKIAVGNNQPDYASKPAAQAHPHASDERHVRSMPAHPVSRPRTSHGTHANSSQHSQPRRHQPVASSRPVGKGAGHPLVHKGQPLRGGGRRRGF
jgi:hypothetical protein